MLICIGVLEREDVLCCACITDGLSNPDLSPEGEGRLHLFLIYHFDHLFGFLFINRPRYTEFFSSDPTYRFSNIFWQFCSTHRGNEKRRNYFKEKVFAKRYFFNTNLFSPFSIFLLFQRSKYHGKIRVWETWESNQISFQLPFPTIHFHIHFRNVYLSIYMNNKSVQFNQSEACIC